MHNKKKRYDSKNGHSESREDMTNFQTNAENTSDVDENDDKMADAADDENDSDESPDWEEKYDELNDTYLRLMAEFDNYRKRTLREKADLIRNGGESALTNLLPVIDDFERALSNMRQTEDLSAIIQGIELIYSKFASYLSQQGVKVIETQEQPFDTELHEAIATIPAPEEDLQGKILDCVQTGYTLHDKVIRHAKVVVGA
ncbi:MAG: nucleotide exchange factor GrpE [Tannerella sp.]|jgi:molecular chaperone GrpE|nr:nucleotide exchange factor GrpE [Tannerella sp.]